MKSEWDQVYESQLANIEAGICHVQDTLVGDTSYHYCSVWQAEDVVEIGLTIK